MAAGHGRSPAGRPMGMVSGLPEGQRLTRESQDAGVPVYRRARLARPRELRRAPPARAPKQREPTPPSDSEFPSLCCVSPLPRPRSRSAGNGRGLGGARPSSCPDWLMQLSILNLFFDGGGGATRSAPDHVCHPQPTTLVQVRGQEAIGGKRARHPRPRPVLAGPRRNILHSRPLPHRGIGAAASQEGRSEM